ncbi:head completion/stabilization protein [Phenylobacterium sp.]|uniref:head completion/stabilization protein n=1 Tax=Phenylobacterium sp. TaxID=1871053 RepID=UPI00301CC784
MTSFVSPPPLNPAEIPPAAPADVVLEGDAFWPDIDLADLRLVMRIDPAVDLAWLREAAIFAILSTRRELAAWKAAHLTAGRESLDDVPGEVIEGVAEAVILYTRAVYAATAADLLERMRELGLTAAGHDRADDLQAAAGEHRRAQRSAVRDLLGESRIFAELV